MRDFSNIATHATIISLYPFSIRDQFKPGLLPSNYTILAGDPVLDKLGLTYIDTVRRRVDMGQDRGGTQYVPTLASEVATSLVFDFLRATLHANEHSHPAIFWVEGKHDEVSAKSKFKKEIEEAKQKQANWFQILVEQADADWSMVKNVRQITNVQKYAAVYLKLDREWITAQEIQKSLSVCPICTTKISPAAIKCPNCDTIIKAKEYAEYLKKVSVA